MSEPLWRWRELCEALDLAPENGPDVHGISIDSRSINAGDLFIALTGDPGQRFNPSHRSDRDGHSFIDQALARGAAGVVSHDAIQRVCPELKVADTLDALWALGRAARSRFTGSVVAITGSSGKTTTKTLLSAALGAFSTPGSLNNHLGVPLSLARTPRVAPAAVYEIGMNHPGEIAPLAELVRPDVAVVLNVHQAHAEYFPDAAALRTEKLSIYKGLSDKGILVSEDLIDLKELPQTLRHLRFGKSSGADVRLVAVTADSAEYRIDGHAIRAHVPGGGAHRAASLAAVLAVLKALDRPLAAALDLDDQLIPKGRGNRTRVAGITLIDDSYNANPASMKAALQTLQQTQGRRFALLGEMLELGRESEAGHAGLASACVGLEHIYCVGTGMQALADRLPPGHHSHYPAADDALLDVLTAQLQAGDTLLIKGSNRVFWAQGYVDRLLERLRKRSVAG